MLDLDLNLIPIAYAYPSPQAALDAVERLKGEGFEETDMSVVTPSMIRSSKAALMEPDSLAELGLVIQGVHDSGRIPDEHAVVYARNLQQEKVLLVFTPPFGRAARAEALLLDTDAIDVGPLPEVEFHTWLQAAPLSALLRLPVLSHGRSRLGRVFGDPLADPDFLPGRFFGKLLSDKPTPLSSAAGLPVLSDNPTPLSSKIGMPVLSDEPAPLSSAIGMPLLTERRPAGKTRSFGLPLLSRDNPTPLSSLLGLPVLTRDQSGKARVG